MSTKPKNPAQTESEMLEDVKANKAEKNHHYKVQGDKHRAEVLGALVRRSAAQLDEADKRKIPLSDTGAVKAQAMLYLKACEQVGAFPSIVGLSRALGYTRRALYREIDERSFPDTANFLELFRDTCSDILSESALANNANTIAAIFIQKAVYGLRESVEIVAKVDNPLGGNIDPEQIRKQIEALPSANYELPEE